MNTRLSFSLACFLAASGLAAAQEETPLSEANTLLKDTLTRMSKVTSFHAQAELEFSGKKARIDGYLGVGAVDLKVREITGTTKLRRVAEKQFFISEDGGKTWKEDAERDSTIFLSKAITGPISAEPKIWEKAEFTRAEGDLDGENVVILRKPAKKDEPAVVYWVAKDAEAGGSVVRKASMTISAEDGDFPITILYSELNKPVSIKAPAGAVAAAEAGEKPAKAKEEGGNQNDTVAALKNTVGSFGAQGLLTSFMAVNSLSDAYAKKAYAKKEAGQILEIYEKTTSGFRKSLEQLLEVSGMDEGDLAAIKKLVEGYKLVENQVAALKGILETGSKDQIQKFEDNRLKGQKILDGLMKGGEQ